MIARACSLLLVGAVLLSGCGEAGQAAEIPEALAVEPVSTGEEPRRELRYRLTTGQRDTTELRMTMAMGGMPGMGEVAIPPMVMTFHTEVLEPTEAGDYRIGYEYTEAYVDAGPDDDRRMVQAMEAQLAPLVGLTGEFIMNARGEMLEHTVDMPDDMAPQMREQVAQMEQAMDQFASPLPEEAVGQGAQWRVVMPVDMPNMRLVQFVDVTLAEMDGDDMKMRFDIEQTAPPQTITEQGHEFEMRAYKATGHGEMAVNLTTGTPRGFTEVDVAFEMVGEGMPDPMRMTMSMRIDMSEPEPEEDEQGAEGGQ
ncbi:MAG: hypothetical protein WD009_05160 [Phycisphaeraceae bacterium]